ncbi:uncharacterized protein EV422DRAFT_503443 [Fimicolochytrium jonesii]|uniref:uncharacterized protein n=1 Tax=Fimicolochytrium jonesii TaxID=1396493 RepID=UPI0022FF1789|nr:uncharacterized protein EV422DRAFT_503443 [Fimicolochytrium jonesii]KAI8826125.1 hypothetical protein EV422DRAFT_503443 [Fimicolochytrium jonesii]
MARITKSKVAKRPTFKSKKPAELVQYHLNSISHLIVKRYYNDKTGVFYLGPDRNKFNYVSQKTKYHVDGLRKLINCCVFEANRPEEETCTCRNTRKCLLEALGDLVEFAQKATDDELQVKLQNCRQIAMSCMVTNRQVV